MTKSPLDLYSNALSFKFLTSYTFDICTLALSLIVSGTNASYIQPADRELYALHRTCCSVSSVSEEQIQQGCDPYTSAVLAS